MSEQLSKRAEQALEVWDGLPSDGRNYAAVAEAMGISHGRAAVYVRDALRFHDRFDEAPRRGNGTAAAPPQSPRDMMEAEAAKLRERIEAKEATLNEATEPFDADQWRADQEAKLAQAVKDAQATLKAFKADTDGVATQAAEAEAAKREQRAAKVKAGTEAQLEALRGSLAGFEAALKALPA